MTIRNKNKDHIKNHEIVEITLATTPIKSDDPLRFWTGHATENTLIDLYEFANGATTTNNPFGGGRWAGAFSARPELITEIAAAIQARLMYKAKETCSQYLKSLRKFWRTCDQMELNDLSNGYTLDRLISVRDLTNLHEVAMYRAKFNETQFLCAQTIFNDTRRLMRLGPLMWMTPKRSEPDRQLIPDAHAKALKIGIKRDWERVRITWERNDAIRRGEEPDTLNEFEKQNANIANEYEEQNKVLRKNWLHLHRIQLSTKKALPSTSQLYEGKPEYFHNNHGIYVSIMRAISYPTLEEANIAFHSALIRSGWNPSTLITGLDANLPSSIFQHPKDAKQRVLCVESEDGGSEEISEEYHMQGVKRRAGGRLQFCMGLKKDPDSPPNIVAIYLERTKELRIQLHQDVEKAKADYQRLQLMGAPKKEIESQFKRLQTLQQGTRNVWLYVDYKCPSKSKLVLLPEFRKNVVQVSLQG